MSALMPQSVFSPKRTALAVRRSEKRAKVVPPPTTVTKKLDEELDAACVSMLDILDRDAMGQVLEASCAGDKRMPCRLGMVSKQVRDMLPSRMKDDLRSVGVVLGIGSRVPLLPTLSSDEMQLIQRCACARGMCATR